MWCAGNQTCGVKTPERQHDCLVRRRHSYGFHARRSRFSSNSPLTRICHAACVQVNWGSHAVNQLAQCPTRLLFECNATATHGHGGTGGCTACSACCHGDFISDGKECDTCVKDLCPAPSNCKHVLPRLCSQAKREDIKACNGAPIHGSARASNVRCHPRVATHLCVICAVLCCASDCVTLNTKELLGWGCTTGNITSYCEAPDRP